MAKVRQSHGQLGQWGTGDVEFDAKFHLLHRGVLTVDTRYIITRKNMASHPQGIVGCAQVDPRILCYQKLVDLPLLPCLVERSC